MSYPDLKLVSESLLYKSGLFTIKEQEDCRETAENLVYFIQSIQFLVKKI